MTILGIAFSMALPITPIHHRLRTRTGQIVAVGRVLNRQRFRPSLLQNIVGGATLLGAAALGYGAIKLSGAAGYTPIEAPVGSAKMGYLSKRRYGPGYDPNYRKVGHRYSRRAISKRMVARPRYRAGRRNMKIPRLELKFYDQDTSQGTVSASGEITTLLSGASAGIVVGTNQTNRIGRKITIKALTIKGVWFKNNATAAENNDVVRISVLLDRQANGALPAYSDIYTTGADDLLGFNELYNTNRFKTLCTDTFTLNFNCAQGNGTTILLVGEQKYYEKHLTLNYPIEYNNTVGTSGTIDEIMSNNLLLVMSSLHGVSSRTFSTRVRFVDGI